LYSYICFAFLTFVVRILTFFVRTKAKAKAKAKANANAIVQIRTQVHFVFKCTSTNKKNAQVKIRTMEQGELTLQNQFLNKE